MTTRQEIRIKSLERAIEKRKEAEERRAKRLQKRIELAKGKPNREGINALKKKLKTVTHAIVRLKYDNCYSCDKFVPLKERQAGHYHTDGGNPGTRYDFDNLRTQHAMCNNFKGGDAHFGARLLQEIGEERFLALDAKRKIKPIWTRIELERLIEERTILLNQLTAKLP